MTSPVQNAEYCFDPWTAILQNIGGSWFDICVSSTFRVSEAVEFVSLTATGTVPSTGRKLFDIHSRLLRPDWRRGGLDDRMGWWR